MRSSDRRGAKILIAEDDEFIRELLVTRLELAGYRTAEARDGRGALERWATFLPDVAILDINMPRLDGFGVLAALRDRDQLKKTPVLILTARTARADLERARSLGATDYLLKPFNDQNLLQRMSRLAQLSSTLVSRA